MGSPSGALRPALGIVERRDNDYFGSAVNRAAGRGRGARRPVLLSAAVADGVRDRLPPTCAARPRRGPAARFSIPEHLYQLAHAEIACEFPALRSPTRHRTTCAQSLVYRSGSDMPSQAPADGTRLPHAAGAGASARPAVAAGGRDVVDGYPDGAWSWGSKRSRSGPGPAGRAQALGVRGNPATPLREA